MATTMDDQRVLGVCPLSTLFIISRLTMGLQYEPLIQPALLRHEIASSQEAKTTIAEARQVAAKIIAGEDDRLVVVVGPCSIHSPEQALEYARLLKAKIPEWPNLLIIMRSYL